MEGWQYKAAFVIQFREDTDIAAGRFEGKAVSVLTEVRKPDHYNPQSQ